MNILFPFGLKIGAVEHYLSIPSDTIVKSIPRISILFIFFYIPKLFIFLAHNSYSHCESDTRIMTNWLGRLQLLFLFTKTQMEQFSAQKYLRCLFFNFDVSSAMLRSLSGNMFSFSSKNFEFIFGGFSSRRLFTQLSNSKCKIGIRSYLASSFQSDSYL